MDPDDWTPVYDDDDLPFYQRELDFDDEPRERGWSGVGCRGQLLQLLPNFLISERFFFKSATYVFVIASIFNCHSLS